MTTTDPPQTFASRRLERDAHTTATVRGRRSDAGRSATTLPTNGPTTNAAGAPTSAAADDERRWGA
jgi:hypothetical protein